eukprot:CAMPEP_0206004230 /NCGR_PEP_ID=MMETSP1464-20131121/3840_1 /ASSEMBLY_ACC=CAM_ASM_001124 /TAXON_ID=119497 /ORGANISM="Exanthemachrysis gayraliae, Strain RCC1523" /LENGTH=348 /DNA_ID=CAMNT_0053377633 /DNA_START=162 /DNA_END=1204 /DNA_ORIENTATION=-
MPMPCATQRALAAVVTPATPAASSPSHAENANQSAASPTYPSEGTGQDHMPLQIESAARQQRMPWTALPPPAAAASSALLELLEGLLAAEPARAPGRDEAGLAAGRRVPLARGRVANVLVVATTVRVLHWVHGHAAHLGPRVALHAVLVVGAAGLEEGLVDAAAAGHDAHHGTALAVDGLLHAGRQPDAHLAVLQLVDHLREVARGAREAAAVRGLVLHVADDGAGGHLAHGHHVPGEELGLLAAVHRLTRVHALGGHESLVDLPVFVRAPELDARKRRAAARVVDDVRDHALDVALALRIVERAELRRTLAVVRVRLEDGAAAFALGADHATHGSLPASGNGVFESG